MVAENLKQRAALDAKKSTEQEQNEDRAFDARAAAWAQEVKRRWEVQKQARP